MTLRAATQRARVEAMCITTRFDLRPMAILATSWLIVAAVAVFLVFAVPSDEPADASQGATQTGTIERAEAAPEAIAPHGPQDAPLWSQAGPPTERETLDPFQRLPEGSRLSGRRDYGGRSTQPAMFRAFEHFNWR